MTKFELMQSMVEMNEALLNRRLGFFEKAYGYLCMIVQSKAELTEAEFSFRAYFVNMDAEN